MGAAKPFSAESTRREFLKTGSLAGASLVIGFHLPGRMTEQREGSNGKDSARETSHRMRSLRLSLTAIFF